MTSGSRKPSNWQATGDIMWASCKGGAGKQSTSLRGAPSHGTIKKVRVWETKLPKNLIVEKA